MRVGRAEAFQHDRVVIQTRAAREKRLRDERRLFRDVQWDIEEIRYDAKQHERRKRENEQNPEDAPLDRGLGGVGHGWFSNVRICRFFRQATDTYSVHFSELMSRMAVAFNLIQSNIHTTDFPITKMLHFLSNQYIIAILNIYKNQSNSLLSSDFTSKIPP
jgi:hypothetical protein